MSGYVSQGSEIEGPHFGSAWIGHDGKPRSTVHLGNATLSFDTVDDAVDTSKACSKAAIEMTKLTLRGGPPGEPGTFAAGHALIVEFTENPDFREDVAPFATARCQCGDPLGNPGPARNLSDFAVPWDDHLTALRPPRPAKTPAGAGQ